MKRGQAKNAKLAVPNGRTSSPITSVVAVRRVVIGPHRVFSHRSMETAQTCADHLACDLRNWAKAFNVTSET